MKRDEQMTIGDRIAVARDRYKLSQGQLAAQVGVTRAAVSQYEQDKIRPRARIIDRLAELFNAAPEWFERGRGKAPDVLDAPVTIPEISVGRLTLEIDDARDLTLGRLWQLPTAMFPDVEVADDMLAIVAPNNAGAIRCGDRVVIDTRRREAADAVFLAVDATGPKLCSYEALRDDADARIIGQAIAYFRVL